MTTTKIDFRFRAIDGTWELEVWADGHVALKLAIPKDRVDVMLYEIEARGHTIMTECSGRWLFDANDGPASRRGR